MVQRATLAKLWGVKTQPKKIALALLGAIFFLYCLLRLLDVCFPPNIERYQDASLVVSDVNGEWLRVYLSRDEKRRISTNHRLFPKDYLHLLILYEDQDFYQHNGVDFSAIVRAVWQNISAQKTISGASTLTMQTVKLLTPKPRTFGNKIIEMFRAWQLERRFSKTEILDMYSTLAPVGGNLEGLRAASYAYLNKPLERASLGEAAWLVVLPQSPNRLSANPQAAIAARNKVLKRAADKGLISAVRYQQALREPLQIQSNAFPFSAPHFSNRVKRQYEHKPSVLSEDYVLEAKLPNQLRTPINKYLQQGVEKILSAHVISQHRKANLAAGILDNRTGQWRAYVGSADFFDHLRNGQSDMLAAVRSPGSALKPFITLFALDWLNYQPHTTIDDTPIYAAYQPKNYDAKYQGRITLSEALSRSRNVPAVRLLHRVGVDYFTQALIEQGMPMYFPKKAKPNLSLALGGVGIRAKELAHLYRKLANCSYQIPLQASATPNLASAKACQQISRILFSKTQLKQPLLYGGEPVSFKTGTAYGWRDRWVFAYSKDYTLVLWAGRADGRFAEKRASAEALLPILRELLAILPTPSSAQALPAETKVRGGNAQLPLNLQHVANNLNVNTACIIEPKRAPKQFVVTAPLPDSLIDFRADMPLSLHIQGGTPPYTYFLNDEILAHSHARQQIYLNPSVGNYHLMVIDANGESIESRFRLQNHKPKASAKRAKWK